VTFALSSSASVPSERGSPRRHRDLLGRARSSAPRDSDAFEEGDLVAGCFDALTEEAKPCLSRITSVLPTFRSRPFASM
jgi:hypothetical protein